MTSIGCYSMLGCCSSEQQSPTSAYVHSAQRETAIGDKQQGSDRPALTKDGAVLLR